MGSPTKSDAKKANESEANQPDLSTEDKFKILEKVFEFETKKLAIASKQYDLKISESDQKTAIRSKELEFAKAIAEKDLSLREKQMDNQYSILNKIVLFTLIIIGAILFLYFGFYFYLISSNKTEVILKTLENAEELGSNILKVVGGAIVGYFLRGKSNNKKDKSTND